MSFFHDPIAEFNSDSSYFQRKIEVKPSPIHGVGVFATEDLPSGYCVEKCVVRIFDTSIFQMYEEYFKEKHILQNDYYKWGRENNRALALGYGCLYNHSDNPNIIWSPRLNKWPAMMFFTKRKILAGEELRHQYSNNSQNSQELFEFGQGLI